MNKLREKLAKPFDGLNKETLNKLEQVTDDFTVKFFNWASTYKNNDRNNWNLSTTELQQYFKNDVYGK